MVLTHVYEIDHGRFRHVTPKQVEQKYHRTVSLSEKKLICLLCGQYALFANGERQSKHFRHNHQDELRTKRCPERSMADPAINYKVSYKKVELPLRLKFERNQNSLELQAGILGLPKKTLKKAESKNKSIRIRNSKKTVVSETNYSILDDFKTTFVDLGSKLDEQYEVISLLPDQDNILPSTLHGIRSDGITIFDGISRVKIPYYGSIQAQKKYYLLSKKKMPNMAGLSSRRILKSGFWNLYQISVYLLEPDLIKCFIEQNYFLEEEPIDVFPIWPSTVQQDNQYYSTKPVSLYVQAEDDVDLSSNTSRMLYYGFNHENNWRLLNKLPALNTATYVVAGRNSVAKHAIIRQLDSKRMAERNLKPKVSISRPNKNTASVTENVIIQTQYNGSMHVIRNNKLVEVEDLLSDKKIIKKVQAGDTLEIYQGLDLMKKVTFTSQSITKSEDETKPESMSETKNISKGKDVIGQKENTEENLDQVMLEKMSSYHGPKMVVGHDIGALVNKMHGYPLSQHWVEHQIRKGSIDSRILKILRKSLCRETKECIQLMMILIESQFVKQKKNLLMEKV